MSKEIQFKGDGTGVSGSWEKLENLKASGKTAFIEDGQLDNYGEMQFYEIYELPSGQLVQQVFPSFQGHGFVRMP